MTMRRPARVALLVASLVLLAALGAFVLLQRQSPEIVPPRSPEERPPLVLVTSLPLIFPEEFSLDQVGSPALEALETRYSILPAGVADAQALSGGGLLLMAHPLAQPAEVLVELDSWVRAGGHALILADPRLEWPSGLPLGDLRRPPPFFVDTGLLAHWGLQLDEAAEPGPQERTVDGRDVLLDSPGVLSGSCEIVGEGLVARCPLGGGSATVIADADLLRPRRATESQLQSNLQFLLAELARLEN